MEPIQLGTLQIRPFGLIFAALLVLFFAGSAWLMKKQGLKGGTASWFALLTIPLCLVLSHLGFCLMSADELIGEQDYGLALRFWDGGYLLWGAIGGILIAAKLTGKITGQPGARIADSVIVPVCLMIVAIRLLCGLMFSDFGIGMNLEKWFDPEEADFAYRYSLWPLEDWSFFERLPFAVENYYGDMCWAVFMLQALWAGITAFISCRPKAAPGGRTVRFVVLYSSGTIVMESMLHTGHIIRLPWLAFVKANQILCAVAILAAAVFCLRRLKEGSRLNQALRFFPQFLAAIGIIIALEFAAFEKKIVLIEWLPADACHLLMAAACAWIALAFRPLWKKAFPVHSEA